MQPGQLLIDPDCQSWWDFSDCQYTIEWQRLSAPQIKHYYGIDEESYATSSNTESGMLSTGMSFFNKVSQMFNKNTQSNEYTINYYDVYTLYYREVMGISDVDAIDAPEVTPMMKMTFIGEAYYVESRTRENPWWHKSFPYINFQSAPSPFSQYGVSEVAKNMGTQLAINIARNSALAMAQYNANPGWITEKGAVAQWNLAPGGETRPQR